MPRYLWLLSLVSLSALVNGQDLDYLKLQADLDMYSKRWQETGPSTYTYELTISCFCDESTIAPKVVLVENGEVERVFVKKECEVASLSFGSTVEGLHRDIQNAITMRADVIDVRYNTEFGYPSKVTIDWNSDRTDGQVTHFYKNLSPDVESTPCFSPGDEGLRGTNNGDGESKAMPLGLALFLIACTIITLIACGVLASTCRLSKLDDDEYDQLAEDIAEDEYEDEDDEDGADGYDGVVHFVADPAELHSAEEDNDSVGDDVEMLRH